LVSALLGKHDRERDWLYGIENLLPVQMVLNCRFDQQSNPSLNRRRHRDCAETLQPSVEKAWKVRRRTGDVVAKFLL
jgi:hypothetical protein